ncbi:MAG: type III pantothenate kinase, partial [Oscillospiraceae bacterium]|nr:type III pantothenate kinase [Oscillospiraceae bacterium]
MILALDVGNTNITVGCINGNDIENVFRISTNAARTADEFTIQIDTLLTFRGIESSSIEGAVISSVVPQLTNTFKETVIQLAGVEPVIVGAGVKTGL